MNTWCPLWSDITRSSIWDANNDVRILWITMLAMKDQDGMVDASITGLAAYARLPLATVEKALAVLEAPDPHSRSQEFEGRRVARKEGGWVVLNHLKYRDRIKGEYKRAANAARVRKHRAKQQAKYPGLEGTDKPVEYKDAANELANQPNS
jgi:hypothetical protein